ncbi:hypothetical protein [Kribbella catacumbae]|uniref:hypothetical protein n=1 Tax=Kribbella catacumbae TaxID=460086 RepID=UPI0012F8A6A5|nr:hypothetical protein [Kribbella catacumbae]
MVRAGLAQSGGEGLGRFDSSALPVDGGRARGRGTEPAAGAGARSAEPAAEGDERAAYGHGADAGSRVEGPDVLPGAWADDSPMVERPVAAGWDDVEVERVLERVLGDAARRHGIEV